MTRGRYTGGKPPLVKDQVGPSPLIAFRVPQAVRQDLDDVAEKTGKTWSSIARDGVTKEVARLKKASSRRRTG